MKILLAWSMVFLTSCYTMAESLTVGSAAANPGQKVFGTLEVGAGKDAGVSIPVAVIRGTKPGPVLSLVAGLHGTEYASIIELNPAEISGTVIVLPLVNISSFENKVPHVNPVDEKSMNRFYPGNADGSQTERVSWEITKQVVERSDYLIDYHGGDLDENLRPYAYWPKSGGGRVEDATRQMAQAFGLDHIIVWNDLPTDPNASRYLVSTATTRGKPSIAVEAGYSGTVMPDDVRLLVDGTFSVMRHLKMLPGNANSVEHPVWIGKVDTVTSNEGGIFYPLVAKGTYVAEGTKLGYVTDYFGRVVYEAKSPVAGEVLYICSVPSMKKGGTVANVGEVTTNP
jgi:predicted deacylase